MTTEGVHLPVGRISTIMKSSVDADNISKESARMMAKATELFIRALTREATKSAKHDNQVDYKHLVKVVNSHEKYEFIRDILPTKITMARYKKLNQLRYNDNEESDRSTSSEESENEEGSTEESSETE